MVTMILFTKIGEAMESCLDNISHVFGMFLGPLSKKILSKSKEVYGKSPPLAQPLLPFWRMVVSRPGEMIAMVEIVP